jgi:hypothetical protein
MPFPYMKEFVEGQMFPEKRAFTGRSPADRFFRPVSGFIGNSIDFVMEGEVEDPERWLHDTIQIIGLGLHIPVGQPDLWISNFWDGQRMESPRDLIWRKPRDRR